MTTTAIAQAAPRATRLSWARAPSSSVVVGLEERQSSSRLLALATVGTMVFVVAYPALQVFRIAITRPPYGGKWIQAVVATSVFLPLYVRHVLYGVRGSRPAGAMVTLFAMAIVIIGAVPLIGVLWLPSLHAIALSVLILVRRRWSLVIFAILVVAPIPLAFALGFPKYGALGAYAVAFGALTPFVMIWLIGAVRQLEAVRQALTEEAVTRERVRIDDEIGRTLGESLREIDDKAQRALVQPHPHSVEQGLRELVEGSRRTLTAARQMIRGYQRVSLRAELESAATLLTAAGIATRVEVPEGDIPDTLQEGLRSALRSATVRLLADRETRSCVLRVTRQRGQLRLDLLSEQTGRVTTELTAT